MILWLPDSPSDWNLPHLSVSPPPRLGFHSPYCDTAKGDSHQKAKKMILPALGLSASQTMTSISLLCYKVLSLKYFVIAMKHRLTVPLFLVHVSIMNYFWDVYVGRNEVTRRGYVLPWYQKTWAPTWWIRIPIFKHRLKTSNAFIICNRRTKELEPCKGTSFWEANDLMCKFPGLSTWPNNKYKYINKDSFQIIS